ncbi:MAG: AMP-binding protein, partial [Sphingomicrobium sp.]
MSQKIVSVPPGFDARIGPAELAALNEAFAADRDRFWLDQTKRLDWVSAPTMAGDWSFAKDEFHIRWYADGTLNLSVNCLDRHLAERGNNTALIFEADEPGEGRPVTYRILYEETCRFANALKSRGVKRGDRVMIYMPMIPEAAAAMLACARIGAVHSVVFGGFSPESLAGRIEDCGAVAVITADEGRRGGKAIPLKANVDKALETSPVDTVIVVRRTGSDVAMVAGRDLDWTNIRL